MKNLQKVALLVGILTLTNTGLFGAEDASGMSGLGLGSPAEATSPATPESTSPSTVELSGIKVEVPAVSPTSSSPSATALTTTSSAVATPAQQSLWLRAKKSAPEWYGLAALVSAQISDAFIFDYLITGQDRYPKEAYAADAVIGFGAFTLATISAAKKIQTRMIKTGQSAWDIVKKEMKEHPEVVVMTAAALLSQASGIGQIVDMATDSPATPDGLYGTASVLSTGLNAAALGSRLIKGAREKYNNFLWQRTLKQEATSPASGSQAETKESAMIEATSSPV